MQRKITRIILKSTGIALLLLLLLSIVLFFAVQTFTFQTWLAQKAGKYLGEELHTTVRVEKVELELFSKAHINGILILDQKKDTLLCGDILIDISNFNYGQRSLDLDKIVLRNFTAKIIKYKADSTFNFKFIADYFKPSHTDTTPSREWKVNFGDLGLQNLNFVYRKEKFAEPPSNNINFDDIHVQHTYGTVSGFKMDGDTVVAQIKELRTWEKSGFAVSRLNTKARISEKRLLCEDLLIQTPKSNIRGKVDFRYDSWDDYSDFINKVRMDSYLLDSTYVSFEDIAAFTSELNGLDKRVSVSGSVKGTVSDMRLKNFALSFGTVSKFKGNLQMTGLPDINTTYLHFDAKELATSYSDLTSIPNYPFHEGKKLVLPKELNSLGTISYKGKFDGFITDFTAYGVFKTGLGKVETDLSVSIPQKGGLVSYHGKIRTQNFGLGTLLGQSDLNNLSMDAEVNGQGSSLKDLEAEFNGKVNSIRYNDYDYSNITLNGNISKRLFNGLLISKDPNADFDFNGTINFTNEVPELDFISTINKLNLRQLHFTTSKDSGVLSSQILINLKGDNINNLTGIVNFDNTQYKTKTRTFKLSTFDIHAEQNTADKKIRMTSEYVNATVLGQFKYENLKPAIETMLNFYYPTFFKKPNHKGKFTDQLSFHILVKKFKTINELFVPDLMLSANTVLDGTMNASEKKLNLQLTSGKIEYQKFYANDLVFILNQNNNNVLAEASGKALHLTDSLSMDNFNVSVNSTDTTSSYSADWANLSGPSNKGEIKGELKFDNNSFVINNKTLSLTFRDSTWIQTNPAVAQINKDGSMRISPFEITNKLQKLNMSGALSKSRTDSLNIDLQQLGLQQFNPLLSLVGLQLKGIANGKVTLNNENDIFAYNGFLKMDELKINDNLIGQLVVHTNYHNTAKYITLDGYTSLGILDEVGEPTKNIAFNGSYDLEKKEESIDIDFSAKPANLSLLNPFLTDILTIKNGFVNGSGKVHGTPDNVKLDGKFRLFNSEIKVDYTNVVYSITGDIEVMPDQIRFSDMYIREKGSKSAAQGTLNGNFFHRNFKDLQIDYDISYRNMLVLNTTQIENPSFYGRIYGTGNVGIWGYLNNLHMLIDNTTNKHSKFVLPLDGPAEAGENDFIYFVKKDTILKTDEKALTGFDLEMKLHATPDAQVQIIIDQKSGDMLNVQGRGDLNLTINTLGKFEMLGDYIITDGDYLFTLENLINKKFDIESGSSIRWSGDPLNAEIDITTNYRQRASIAPLLNDSSKARTPVECKLIITDKLFSPNINFAIEFPNIDATSRAKINSVLSDETELNRQVFSFLLFRSFVTPLIYNTGSAGLSTGGAAASTSSELLSNRVSEFLNTYFGSLSGIQDLQLGVNYRPGTYNSNEAVDLAVSKQFLDNRVSVDGNFGVNSNAHSSNGFIGDVNVEYKITEDGRFRLKGFNRTNDNTQLTIAGGPYTQGVGFFYRVDFETFEELKKRIQKSIDKKGLQTP